MDLGFVYKCASYLVLAALAALNHVDSIPEFWNDRMKIGRLFILRPLFCATRLGVGDIIEIIIDSRYIAFLQLTCKLSLSKKIDLEIIKNYRYQKCASDSIR